MSELTTTKRKYVRVDPSTWSEIEALWEAGDVTLQDLEGRFGVSRRALQCHFSKHSVTKGAKAAEMAAVVKDRVLTEALPNADETVARAKATREAAYQNAVVVEELIMAQLAAAQKDPSHALKAASALKALSLAAAALERTHQLKWKALGLDKDSIQADDLPVLVFEDLTAQEIQAIQEHDQDEDSQWELPTPPRADLREGHADEEDEVVLIDLEASDTSRNVLPDGTRMVREAN